MRHDDRYSMVNKRYAHVMAQHGVSNVNHRISFFSGNELSAESLLGIDLIGTVWLAISGLI